MKKSILLRSLLIFSLFLFAKNIQAQLTATISSSGCFGEPVDLFVNGGSEPYLIDWGAGNTTTGDVNQNSFVHIYNFVGIMIINVIDTQGDSAQVFVEVICTYHVLRP